MGADESEDPATTTGAGLAGLKVGAVALRAPTCGGMNLGVVELGRLMLGFEKNEVIGACACTIGLGVDRV